MNKLRVIELFGGIGALSKALKRSGVPHEIVDYVEIDSFAVKSYNALNGTSFIAQDICEWDKDIKADLIMHGSPCQDFSIAGRQAGGNKDSGTRSSLMYETIRIVEKVRPKYVIWENVKNLLSARHLPNFNNYLEAMSSLGYTNHFKVLNAKDYGIPQNRERVFTVSILNGEDVDFSFPEPILLEKHLIDFLEDEVEERYFLSEAQSETLILNYKEFTNKDKANVEGMLDIKGIEQVRRVYDKESLCPTLSTMQGGNRQPKIRTANKQGYDIAQNGDGIDLTYPNSTTRRGRVGHGVAKTIPAKDVIGALQHDRVRRLTPRECWRLMGFDDEDFDKASAVCSNSQLYKQAGNSIVVNVLEAIIRHNM